MVTADTTCEGSPIRLRALPAVALQHCSLSLQHGDARELAICEARCLIEEVLSLFRMITALCRNTWVRKPSACTKCKGTIPW